MRQFTGKLGKGFSKFLFPILLKIISYKNNFKSLGKIKNLQDLYFD